MTAHPPKMIRHAYQPGPMGCRRCGRTEENDLHRLWAACSVCEAIVKPYELDDSGRCDRCAP